MNSMKNENGPAILTDITKCIGCRDCVVACRIENNNDPGKPRRWDLEDGLSSKNWASIVEKDGRWHVRKQCRHCLEPACASACPVGALHLTDIGAVVYDTHKCLGCRYCMMACAYGIPRYDWEKPVPYVKKCILCFDRISDGKQPACTEACPTGATVFGDRKELIGEAHRRINENPGKYDNKVWGETEVGGTRVIYLAPEGLDLSCLTYGKTMGERSLPETTKVAMNSVPFAFLGMGGAMTGIHWLVKRRMKLQNNRNSNENHNDDKGE